LAVILTVASATNPQPLGVVGSSAAAVVGFQYAFLASTILNGMGLVIALLVGRRKTPTGMLPWSLGTQDATVAQP
jgi:hypothetical protein